MIIFSALFPVAFAIILMTAFHVVPGKALPAALVLTIGSALLFWHIPVPAAAAVTVQGCLKSLDIIFIIYGAVLLLNVLKKGGAVRMINASFSAVSPDRRIQVLIIAWLFGNFIEGAAGFGAAPVLAAPLLVGLGFPVFPALMVSLVCNTLAVPFGAAGTPVITLFSVLPPGENPAAFQGEVLSRLTDLSLYAGSLLPFLAVCCMICLSQQTGKLRAMAEIFPLALAAGLLFCIPWKITAVRCGPELPSILGSVIALPLMILLLKFRILVPKHVWDFAASERPSAEEPQEECRKETMPLWKAWLPYGAIALLLVLTRLPELPFRGWIRAIPAITVPDLFGVAGTGVSFAWGNNPGIFPFLAVSLVSCLLFRFCGKDLHETVSAAGKQVWMAAIAIASSFAIVQIMITTDHNPAGLPGMLAAVAQGIAGVMGKAYLAAAPVIGAFGTFFSGSCTVSNLLFGTLQWNTAHLLGLPESLAAALQTVGGGLGSMIRLSGVVAACAAVNASGSEGKLLLFNLIPCAIMIVLTLLAAWILFC